MAEQNPNISSDKISMMTNDKVIFEMEKTVAIQSKMFKYIILDGLGDEVIPLPNISSEIMVKVVEYCNRHAESTADSIEKFSNGDTKKFDEEFMDVDQKTLFDLIWAANYLEISTLLELTCQTVANMMRGKTPEEIRKIFNIENDYTKEEEEEVRRENAWAFEK